MTLSGDFLAVLVTAALAVVALSPLVLLGLLAKDWKNRKLW